MGERSVAAGIDSRRGLPHPFCSIGATSRATSEVNQWVLITGASAGIGAEFAAQYAARGDHLVLVARRGERLAALAAELTRRHQTKTEIEILDLGRPHAIARLVESLARRERHIDVLINNAGYGMPGSFISHPWAVHLEFQQVMINTIAELTWHLIPHLRAQQGGTIINVASLAGLMPGSAGHTLYGPSKAWLIKFSEALGAELKRDGIRVLALCPGFTVSEFHDVNGMRPQVSLLPRWLWMTASEVVAQGLAAVERGDSIYIPGRINRGLALLARVLPGGVLRALIARREHTFRRID